MSNSSIPLKCFVSYSHADAKLKNKFDVHLAELKRVAKIDAWYDGEIPAGAVIDDEVKKNLEDSDVVFLLISPNYISSYYCYEIELKAAIKKHRAGKAKVFPILLKEISYFEGHPFSNLKTLPKDKKPVLSNHFKNIDEGFTDAFKIIIRDIMYFQKRTISKVQESKQKSIKNANNTFDNKKNKPSPSLSFEFVKNGEMVLVEVKQKFIEIMQGKYISKEKGLIGDFNNKLRTHVNEFEKTYNSNTRKGKGYSKNSSWQIRLLNRYLFELCSSIQKNMIGTEDTCVHIRHLNGENYTTFVSIGYDDPYIKKGDLPSKRGTIERSNYLEYPVIKSFNPKLHRLTHPDEVVPRDYITFTFNELKKHYSCDITMCISYMGNKTKNKYMLMAMSVLRLDLLIQIYIEEYIKACKNIDKKLNYNQIGG